MFSGPAITAIIIGVVAAFFFGGGFAVSDWRSGEEIACLASNKVVLGAANDKCTADVQLVRQGLDEIKVAAEVRVKAAEAEMDNAKARATKHSRAASAITAAPVIPDEPNARLLSASRESMFKPALSHDALEQVLHCWSDALLPALPHAHMRSVVCTSCPNLGYVSPSNCRVSGISAGIISFLMIRT